MKFGTVEAYGLFYRMREFLQTCPELSQLTPQLKEAQAIKLELSFLGGFFGITTEETRKGATHLDIEVHPAVYIAETLRKIEQEGWSFVETEGVRGITDSLNAKGVLEEDQSKILETLRECLKEQFNFGYPASDFRSIFALTGVERNDDWGADPSWVVAYNGQRYKL